MIPLPAKSKPFPAAFHVLGLTATLLVALFGYLIVSFYFPGDLDAFFAALAAAFVLMEVSYLFRLRGAGSGGAKLLVGTLGGLGVKLFLVFAAYLAVRLFSSVDPGKFLIFLVATYFPLFNIEVAYLLKFEMNRNNER